MRNPNVIVGCGGVFLAIGPRMQQFVTDKGIVPSGRATWTNFEHPSLGKFGMIVVYSPNEPHFRARLWSEIADDIDKKGSG